MRRRKRSWRRRRRRRVTLTSLELKVALQNLQVTLLPSHSLSACLAMWSRGTKAWQVSHCSCSCSQLPSCCACKPQETQCRSITAKPHLATSVTPPHFQNYKSRRTKNEAKTSSSVLKDFTKTVKLMVQIPCNSTELSRFSTKGLTRSGVMQPKPPQQAQASHRN